MASPQSLTLTRPDDWHLHLRDGAAMAAVLPATARQFARAIVMPNLKPPVVTAAQAIEYRGRIVNALPAGSDFKPLMTLYLTDQLAPAEIVRAKAAGVVAVKLYPAGATTNSDAGVTDMRNVSATLEAMQREGMLLLVHGEVTDPSIDVFDREAVFIERVMQPLRRDFPALKVVFEHITTKEAAQYVADSGANTAATDHRAPPAVQPQRHLHGWAAAALLLPAGAQARSAPPGAGGVPPPSGSAKFFLGTDSAPHAARLKEASVCGAGCYTAPAALELYAEAFEAADALDKLEAFASFNGPDFYGLPRNSGTVTLRREPWQLPDSVPFGDAQLKPLRGGETLNWRLAA